MSIISEIGDWVLSLYFEQYPLLATQPVVVIAWLDGETADIRGADLGLDGFDYVGNLVKEVGRKADVLISSQPVALLSGKVWQVTLISVNGETDTVGIRSLAHLFGQTEPDVLSDEDAYLLNDFIVECINPMHSLSKSAFAA